MGKSKWDWIGDRLRELSLGDLAEMAYKIDASLLDIYGKNSTPQWDNRMEWSERSWDRCTTKWEKLYLLQAVMGEPAFCTACQMDKVCSMCRFGEANGICDKEGSIFSTLTDKVEGLINKEEVKDETRLHC